MDTSAPQSPSPPLSLLLSPFLEPQRIRSRAHCILPSAFIEFISFFSKGFPAPVLDPDGMAITADVVPALRERTARRECLNDATVAWDTVLSGQEKRENAKDAKVRNPSQRKSSLTQPRG